MSHDYQYTVLAAFVLSCSLPYSELRSKVISMATGCKCLPQSRLPPLGNALHDSHAEVLARRGAIRWMYQEVQRSPSASAGPDTGQEWLLPKGNGKWGLKDGVHLHMYISTVPCGDASIRFLAATQDEETAALKDSNVYPVLSPGTASRGRDNYSLYGVLRTKPGRADSPPTTCMSCSDKIASWNVLGVQGCLASNIFEPLYLSTTIIGDVEKEMCPVVLEDCRRAFYGRLSSLNHKELPSSYCLNFPLIHFTTVAFTHSPVALRGQSPGRPVPKSSNESLCWIADISGQYEVVVNGSRRGTKANQRGLERYRKDITCVAQHTLLNHLSVRPLLCKASFFKLYCETLVTLNLPAILDDQTYSDVKRRCTDYQIVRGQLKGANGPFSGWLVKGRFCESFDVLGVHHNE